MISSKAFAPSNIALIKYMGKSDDGTNFPAHPSLSLTLSDLGTCVEIDAEIVSHSDEPRIAQARFAEDSTPLLDQEQQKVFRFIEDATPKIANVLRRFDLSIQSGDLNLILRTQNNFPKGAGIASSASSFAAYTLALAGLLAKSREHFNSALNQGSHSHLRSALSEISRLGSGSSCRSFDGPWVLWKGEGACAVTAQLTELTDIIAVVSAETKSIGSREAHVRVKSSPLWQGRIERAQENINSALEALTSGHFRELAQISWRELWEMHSMFHTSSPPFTYWKPSTIALLEWAAAYRDEVMVTMDAGPNLHFLVPVQDSDRWKTKIQSAFPQIPLLISHQGKGATLL